MSLTAIVNGEEVTLSPQEEAAVRAAWAANATQPEPVPPVVSAAQGRLALLDAGLLATVKAAVAQADEATQIWFNRATEWRRDHPILAALGAQLGLSGEAIDDLFRAAALL
ncbi:MAG: hypothetical protein WBA88_05360 [Pseudaminobacter sp.]